MPIETVRRTAVGVAALLAAVALAAPAGGEELTAREIIDRAVEVAEAQRVAGDASRYRSTFEYVVERLDGDGEVERTERSTWEQYPVEGVIFQELVAEEGEPLSPGDAREQRERREEFAAEVRERRARGGDERPDDDNRIELNEDFVSRFEFTIEGEEEHDGIDCWILSLRPRDGDLPVRRRIDEALNKSSGRAWIAKDDFGVSRVEFEMNEPVRYWGGIAGVLRNTVGRLRFMRTAEGVWMPQRIQIRLDLRIVFWNLRRRITQEWEAYERVPTPDEAPADAPAVEEDAPVVRAPVVAAPAVAVPSVAAPGPEPAATAPPRPTAAPAAG